MKGYRLFNFGPFSVSIFLGWCSLIGYSKDDNHSNVTMSGTEVSEKCTATLPASKENEKPKEDKFPICSVCD